MAKKAHQNAPTCTFEGLHKITFFCFPLNVYVFRSQEMKNVEGLDGNTFQRQYVIVMKKVILCKKETEDSKDQDICFCRFS